MSPALGLLTTDDRLTIRGWNSWLASVSGVPEAEAVGRPLLDLVPERAREHLRELFDEVIEHGTTRVLASALHHHLIRCPLQAPSEWFADMEQLVTVAPLRDGDTISGLIVTIEDVTAQREHERALAGDWKTRARAVRALSQTAGDREIAVLLQILERQHLDLNVLSGALQVLVASRHDVLGPLVALLGEPSANLRMHAAQALGLLNDRRAVGALVTALDDSDTNVRFHALEGLGRLRAPEAIEPLVRVAQSGDFFLAFPAVDALALIDDPYVVPELIGLLQHETLGPAIVDALRSMGDEECVAPLIRGLDNETLEPAAVAAAVVAVHDRYEEGDAAGSQIRDLVLATATERTTIRLSEALTGRQEPRAALVRLLGWMGREGVPSLVSVLGESAIQAEVGDAITSVGHAAVEQVIAQLQSANRDVRLAAASLLGRLGDRRAGPSLVEAMSRGDSELTAVAASSLASVGDDQAVEPLFALFGDVQAPVRRAAIAAVNSIGARATERHLLAAFADDNAHVRECAVRVAGYFGFDRCADVMRRALADSSEVVRRAAVEQLPFATDDGTDLLLNALRTESPRNKAAAAHALRLVDGANVEAALIAALGESDPWIRYFAADSLAAHGRAAATEALTAIAEQDEATQVRIAALRTLSALDMDAGARVARRLVDSDDDDLACAAVVALAPAPHPDVDDVLAQAIGQTPARRLAAVEALGMRPGQRAIGILAEAARLPVEPSLAPAAIAALGKVAAADSEAGHQAIAALLVLGSDPEWRSQALRALATLPPHTVGWMRTHLPTLPAIARRVAVESLARMRHPQASNAILGALQDDDPTVRAVAIGAVGRLAPLSAADVVTMMASSDPDPGVRRRAALICGRHGWPDAPGPAVP